MDKFEEISAKNKERYIKNRELRIQKTQEWCSKNRDKRRAISKRHKEKMKNTSPEWVLHQRMRARIRSALIGDGFVKKNSTEEILGCSSEYLKKHIERQFHDGMSWENINNIHIDHIIPLVSAKTEEEVLRLCHFTNLRPMWAKDNLSKGDKIEFLI
jgi:hypothetical protein